ncbi:glycosyltransferase [Nocardia sp. NPDC057030]|uniref:glycosyltransferase n=1 Tax=unclassified Nocardia TaxID=2637762 RepID=UPI003629FCC4
MSMRLGLIARADNRGLGIQLWEAYRHLGPHKTMVVDCRSRAPLPLHLERFPDATVVHGIPTISDCREFLRDLDIVFTAETPYNPQLFAEADRRGVKTVLQYNFELLGHLQQPGLPAPTLFAAPSLWRYDDVRFANKQYLPVPIATDRFPAVARRGPAERFLHIVGRPAVHDRNGTPDLLDALRYVRSPITLTIKCQDPHYVPHLLTTRTIPRHIDLIVDNGDVDHYWDNYTGADVLLMPRRFGGLCLPAQEALGAGMPVVMPAIDPNTWLDPDWLVPARACGSFMAKARIELYSVDPKALAHTIDRFATDAVFYAGAEARARDHAKRLSWDSLKPVYDHTFAHL